MTRSAPRPSVFSSVSALALVTMLGACSQPASYATVDLSGSYSGGNTAQAYSAVTGQPVYQSVSLYGPQSFPDALDYVPNAQLAYADAPVDQVASLGFPGGFETFGVLQQQAVPQYSPQVAPAPFAEAELLSSPQFEQEILSVDRVLANPVPFASPPSFVAPAPFEPITAVEVDSPSAAPAPPPFAPFQRDIEEAPLQPLAAAPVPQAEGGWSGYQPWVAPQYGTEEDILQVPRRVTSTPLAQPVAPPSGPDNDFFNSAAEQPGFLPPKPQETRLPAPSALPAPPPMRIGGGLVVPKASVEYPRPYELLRPGVWPELQAPGQGLVEAPGTTPLPQLAAAEPPVVREPSEDIGTASQRLSGTYNIQRGDTMLTIARRTGFTPEELAQANGLDPHGAIFIGQTLKIPAQADDSLPEAAIPMLDVAEAEIIEATPSDIGGPSVPTIDMKTAMAVIQPASIPVQTEAAPARQTARQFAWPVHGEVYRLESGQLEIDAENNAPVTASASGKVVHVERGPMGVLVVVEHDNGWRSLTVGLDYSAVRPGETVEQGGVIGAASRDHRVRFELRDADAAVADSLVQLRG